MDFKKNKICTLLPTRELLQIKSHTETEIKGMKKNLCK